MANKPSGLSSKNTAMIALIAVVAFFLLSVLWVWGTYNSLVSQEQKVEAQWANVESQYQRRADLIPNLVSSVQGYIKYEKSLLTEITALRSNWQSAATPEDKISSGTALDSAIGRLLVVMENYPDLKADATVIGLMDELAGTENRVAVERQRYNDAARGYNTKLKFFPDNMIAGMFGFKSKPYFSSTPGSEEAPKVVI